MGTFSNVYPKEVFGSTTSFTAFFHDTAAFFTRGGVQSLAKARARREKEHGWVNTVRAVIKRATYVRRGRIWVNNSAG